MEGVVATTPRNPAGGHRGCVIQEQRQGGGARQRAQVAREEFLGPAPRSALPGPGLVGFWANLPLADELGQIFAVGAWEVTWMPVLLAATEHCSPPGSLDGRCQARSAVPGRNAGGTWLGSGLKLKAENLPSTPAGPLSSRMSRSRCSLLAAASWRHLH